MQSKIQDFAKHAKEIYHKGEGAPLPFVTFAFHLTRLLPRDSQFSQVLVLFEISLLALPLGGFAVMPSQKGLLSVRAYQDTGLVQASLSAGGRADCKSDTARFMKRNSSLVLESRVECSDPSGLCLFRPMPVAGGIYFGVSEVQSCTPKAKW